MKRKRTEEDNQNGLKRLRVSYPSLAYTRLAYHAEEYPQKIAHQTLDSNKVSLLRPCAQQCITWQDAVSAFEKFGYGGSIVCKRGDGITRFIGTIPTLRAWWIRYASTPLQNPIVIEENLWSRHPHSDVICLRYTFDGEHHGNLFQLGKRVNHLLLTNDKNQYNTSILYNWKIIPQQQYSPLIYTIASILQQFMHMSKRVLPSKGAIELCWFSNDNCVYIVDCIPHYYNHI